MSPEIPTVFVSMATGTQGGALARQLRGIGWNVRATARDLERPEAKALQDIGVHLTPGHWDDEDALRTALTGCTKAFIGYTANLLDFEAAPRRAQRTVCLAREAGVTQAICTTTLGTAMFDEGREPPIPPTPLFGQHFASKRRVETAIEEGGFDSWTVLRPGFFMANFLEPKVRYGYADVLQKGEWANVMTPDLALGLVDHEYIAKFAAAAFQDPVGFNGIRAGLVTEELPVQEMLDQLAVAIGDGRTLKAHFMTDGEIEKAVADGSWAVFSRERCVRHMDTLVDTKVLEKLVPGLTTFKQYLERERNLVESTYLSS
ncbi:NmrA family protein [Xylariomycetidae sp. FL0641]|nr:NmrA family protein [Xylariomycetidae sp. FL0641]